MRHLRQTAALALALAAVPFAAGATTATPSPAPIPSLNASDPTVARILGDVVKILQNAALGGVNQLDALANGGRGQVTYFRRFEMQIQTGPSRYRDVHLHQGTVINPRGATIAPGQTVTVNGRPRSDGSLDADVITIVR